MVAINIKCSFTAKINGSELIFIIIIHVLENTIMSVHHEMYDTYIYKTSSNNGNSKGKA